MYLGSSFQNMHSDSAILMTKASIYNMQNLTIKEKVRGLERRLRLKGTSYVLEEDLSSALTSASSQPVTPTWDSAI